MTDHPMIFTGPQVKALLDDRKTLHRVALSPQPDFLGGRGDYNDPACWGWEDDGRYAVLRYDGFDGNSHQAKLPYRTGDRIWVQETWSIPDAYLDGSLPDLTVYQATPWAIPGTWRNAETMPRWASRLTLAITDVRVLRLQEISETDAEAEGFRGGIIPGSPMPPRAIGDGWTVESPGCYASPAGLYQVDWIQTHGYDPPLGWEADPWVEAFRFTVHKHNIDRPEADT